MDLDLDTSQLTMDDILSMHRSWIMDLHTSEHRSDEEIVSALHERGLPVRKRQLQDRLAEWSGRSRGHAASAAAAAAADPTAPRYFQPLSRDWLIIAAWPEIPDLERQRRDDEEEDDNDDDEDAYTFSCRDIQSFYERLPLPPLPDRAAARQKEHALGLGLGLGLDRMKSVDKMMRRAAKSEGVQGGRADRGPRTRMRKREKMLGDTRRKMD